LARAHEPRVVVSRSEPAFWRLVLAVVLWVLGGLGWVVPAVLGAGARHLDP